MDLTSTFPRNYSREPLWKCIQNGFKYLECLKTNVVARNMNKIKDNTWSLKDALLPGAVVVLLCIVYCIKCKCAEKTAKRKIKCVVRSKEVNMDIDLQLQEMGIDVNKDLGRSNLPIIVRKCRVSRLEDEISGGLRGFSDEDIMRTILMLLYTPPMGYGMHGSVDDPKNIHYSSETQDYYRYKKLKGIIHLQLDQDGKINFKNCDAEDILKRWITEIQDEIDEM